MSDIETVGMNYICPPVEAGLATLSDARLRQLRQALRYRYQAGLVVADASALIVSFWLAGLLRTTTTVGGGLSVGLLIAPVALVFCVQQRLL